MHLNKTYFEMFNYRYKHEKKTKQNRTHHKLAFNFKWGRLLTKKQRNKKRTTKNPKPKNNKQQTNGVNKVI